MGVSEPLLSAAGIAAAVVAMLVDGRNAALIAVLVIPAGLAPTVAVTSGGPALVVLAGAAVAGLIFGLAIRRTARSLPPAAGLDPLIPAFASSRGLFGPRSARATAAAIAIPMASWVSFHVPIGEITAVQGLLFPVAYVWGCGTLRLIVARTLEDLAVGVVMITLAGAAAWQLRAGPYAAVGAAAVAALAPLAVGVAEWLGARHRARPMAHVAEASP